MPDDQHRGADRRGECAAARSALTIGRQRIAEHEADHHRDEESAGPAQHRQHAPATASTTSAMLRTSTGMCSSTRGGSGSAAGGAGCGSPSGRLVMVHGSVSHMRSAPMKPAVRLRDRLAHRTELPARHGQHLVDAVQPHGPALALFGVVVLLQRAHGAPGHQRVAVHAQELRRVALFQLAQRRVEDVASAGGAHGDVLQFGLEIQHLGQRHALGAAAVLDQQHFGRGRCGRRRRCAWTSRSTFCSAVCRRSSRTGLVR